MTIKVILDTADNAGYEPTSVYLDPAMMAAELAGWPSDEQVEFFNELAAYVEGWPWLAVQLQAICDGELTDEARALMRSIGDYAYPCAV